MKPTINAYLTACQTLCPELSASDLVALGQGLTILELSTRSDFQKPFGVPKQLGFIVKGLMKAIYCNTEGKQVNVNFFTEGMAVGHYQAFMQHQPSRYLFQTLEPTTLVLMSRSHFDFCCQTAPRLERLFRLQLEQAFYAYLQRTENLLVDNAEQRYLAFIQAQPELFSRLSLSDLSSYLGIERQSLMRIRKKLAEMETPKNTIRVCCCAR